MSEEIAYYVSPSSMEPLFPDDASGKLESLATTLVSKAAKLSGTLQYNTQLAIADCFRPMNSYYSNLIEGHDTHPIDIEKALNEEFSENKANRVLQEEARAHINLYQKIASEIKTTSLGVMPSSTEYIKSIHHRFYEFLSEDFKEVKSLSGDLKIVVPGEFRKDEVKVGRHIAPHSATLAAFMDRFEYFYNPISTQNKSKIKRIISIAASHHRLAWIHPFLDGNGRVVRLYSDACFIYEDLDAFGLWSISRGLARNDTAYKGSLANADMQRYNDNDGRGNLSNKMLIEFCVFFLETAIDQIDFMYKILDIDHMRERIRKFSELMVNKGKLRAEAEYLLVDVFLKGKVNRLDAMRITGLSDKTLKILTDSLVKLELIQSKKESIHMNFYPKFPIKYSPMFFPGIYPGNKELEMYAAI